MISFKILTETPTGSKSGDSRISEIVPPRPIGGLQTPNYPDKAEKNRIGASIFVRVSLDATGQVAAIRESFAGTSTGGRFAGDFRCAVEEAIHQWKFVPAESREYVDGKDVNGDGKPDYQVMVSTKPVPVFFDVRFDFIVVDGKGQVQQR